MKKNIFTLVAVFLFAAHTYAAVPALKVLSAAPKGPQGALGRQAVTIHFAEPVVKLGEQSQFNTQDCPLTITPAVAGACRYDGTQTLQFEPDENWPAATQFTVTLPKGFKSAVSGHKLARAYSFTFQTQTPQISTVWPAHNEHWISLTPTLYLLPTMPVDLDKAASFIQLAYMDGKHRKTIPLTVRPVVQAELDKEFKYMDADEKKRLFAAVPTQTLQMGRDYVLEVLPGLPATVGTIGSAQKFTSVFHTYPPLTVQSVQSTGCLPYVANMHLSTPVRKRELWAHLTTVPAAAKQPLTEWEETSVGYEYTNPKTGEAYFNQPLTFINLQPKTPVQVTLHKGMRDIYNNVLAQDYHFTITNDGYCPAVDFSADGLGVLESYLPARLPINLMNISSLYMQAARFNRDNFVTFAQQEPAYCAKKPLAGPTFEGDYAFTDVKDKTQKTYIDLAKFKPTAKDSIIFSQLKTKRGPQQEDCWISSTDNITDIGVTFKTSAENMLLWTTSLQTGQPLPNRQVEVRNKDNQIVWTGVTDGNGLARIPGWKKLNVPAAKWGQPPLYAFITSPNGDAVVSNLWNDGLEPWRFNVDYTYDPTQEALNAYLFTDRGVYRPGETVYVKGVMRERENGIWQLPKSVRAEVSVHDARGEEIFKKTVTLSSRWGSFDTSFELPATAATGYWEISFTPNTAAKEPVYAYGSFQVEAVKPADFNINLRANQPQYTGGEEATFSAAAQYYFGAPLAGAKAQWTLRKENTSFTPQGYDKYTFVPYFLRRPEDGQTPNDLLLNASGELDSRGALLFAAKMPVTALPLRVYTEVDIESPAHQHLFKRTSVLVHPADLYIGAQLTKEDVQAGQPLDIKLVAVTPQGKPTEATVTAEIYKEQYFSVRKVGLAGRLEWVSEKKVTPLPGQTVQVGKKGGTLTFTPPTSGSYYVKLTARDLFGRTVQGGIDTYVYGADHAFVRAQDDDILKLTQNKNEYKVGQKARVRVESPYPTAQALVTVEREGILDAWTTTLSGGKAYVDVPIKENYLPNVYVSVTLVQGRTDKPATHTADLGKPQGKTGYVNLNVVPDKKRITTTLKTNAKSYRPGQSVTVDVSTKVAGKATPAEVVIMAVDEGVLALSNYKTPDLFDFFYGSKPLSVFTMDNRSYVIGQRNFGEKGENRGGGGAANSKLGGTDLRSRFEFTPYFKANVQTDAKGKARVTFTLPDNLTTFRVMAVALTQEEFGAAQTAITVSKPVMVTPQLPQFAREGDLFACGVILYNYEDTKGQFTVQANAQGAVAVQGVSKQQITLAKGQSREVMWMCRALGHGKATLSFSAQGKFADGVEKTIQVSLPEKEQTLSVFGSTVYTKEEMTDEPANLYPTAPNRVTVGLASTALLQLKGALSYLLNYPYNCLEQQLSKITPAVFAAGLVEDFQLADPVALRTQAQTVLTQLPQYQHASGGFGYWPDSLPDPYVTAYALDVALSAKQAGFEVPVSLDKAVAWLEDSAFAANTVQAFPYTATEADTARAYATYVLARYGKYKDSWFNTLYAKRGELSNTALAYLLQTTQFAGGDVVKRTLARMLRGRITYTPTLAYVSNEPASAWLHTSQLSATAHTLQALLETNQTEQTDFQLAAWLVAQLNAQGHWNDTSTNAAALRALQIYYHKHEAQTPAFSASVTQNYQTRLEGTFQGRSEKELTARIPIKQVYADSSEAKFTFAKQGQGTLYYTLSQVYTPALYETPVQAGFEITRHITALDGKPVTQIVAGERYKVTLHIKNAADRTFVVAEDFIPAGFALVNTNLATESATQAELLAADNTAFNRVEQYDERIAAFAGELPAGQYTFSYLVTALSAGRYVYPAAWVSQMYDPAVFGHNTTQVLMIR